MSQRSEVWKHFERIRNSDEAKCLLCKKVLKSKGGSTSSLLNHLRNKHLPCFTQETSRSVQSEDSDDDLQVLSTQKQSTLR